MNINNITPTRRQVLSTAALTAGVFALSACGSGTPKTGTSATPTDLTKAGAATLTMWVDAERAPALKDIVAAFKNDTGIEVKLAVKEFAAVRDDFITQVPTGKGPDLIVGPHDWIGTFVQNGVVAPVQLGDKAGSFQQAAIQAMTYSGNVYGLPYSIENIGLLRNKALVPNEANTFDEVIANGQSLVAVGKAEYPFLVGLDPKQGDPYHLYPLQTSLGVPVFAQNADGSYDPSKLLLGEPKGVEFAKKLSQWGDKGTRILNSNITGDIAKEKFSTGKSPYFLSGPWYVPDIKAGGIDLAVDKLPTTGDKDAQPFITVNGFFISARSANALAANEFVVNYLSSEKAQDSLFTVGGRPPALKSSFDKAASDPIVKAFGAIGANGAPMPAVPEMQAVWADWGSTELALIKGEADPTVAWPEMVANIRKKIAG